MKKKVTLPRVYHPGRGHPPETLAYLSPAEHDLIRRLTDGTAQRGPKGVRSYADDSSSSKGVSRGDTSGTKGSGGIGQGGQAGGSASGSKASGSPSGGVSTGGANRGGNSGVSGSKGGGASTQAPGMGGNAGPIGSRSLSNAASGLASSRQTALGGISQAARNNAGLSNPVSMSGALDGGYYHSFRDTLPGMNNPTQFDRTIRPSGMVNAAHVPMETWSKGYNPNDLTAGAQKIHQAITDNSFRTGTPVDFFSGKAGRAAGTAQHPLGEALDVRLRNPSTGAFVGSETIGPLAANPIGNVNPMKGRTPQVAAAIQNAIGGPYREFATGVLNSFMDNPGVYGAFNNQRWGGSFGGRFGKDYMHYDEGRVNPGVSADQASLRREAANYSGPNAPSTLAGGTQVASLTPFGNLPAAPRAPAGPNIVATATKPAATTTDSSPSFWQQAGNFVKAKTDEVQKKITENKPMLDWAGRHPTLAKIGISIMNAPGGKMPGNLGTAQDRSRMNVPMQAPMQQQFANNYGGGAPATPTNPLTVLSNLKANMIAKGASPEQIAYVQSIIDELSQTQVA